MRPRAIWVACLALTLAQAAAAEVDARLSARLDPDAASAVSAMVAEARAAGIPAEPLVAKALEGASKGATGSRIVSAVRQYSMAMTQALEALGRESREAEIVAGAGALLAGVESDSLARLRSARPSQSLVVPLVVMADLLARKVPASTASGAILAASRVGARDAELLLLRQRVERDIRAGSTPLAAATSRARAMLRGGGIEGGSQGPARPSGRPGDRP